MQTFGAMKLTLSCCLCSAILFFWSVGLISEVLWKEDQCRCNAYNHVYVDTSKWLWLNNISFPMCSVLVLCVFLVENYSLLLTKNKKKEKKEKSSTHFPPCCLCCLLMSFSQKGFLKKDLKQTHFHGLKREILYLFCTCIINQDVFNYFGCWNKACEVVYSVAEFSLFCLATVVQLMFDWWSRR